VRHQAVPLFAAATILIGVAGLSATAGAQTAPAAAPSASPSPLPTTKPASRFNLKIETYTSGTNNQFVGPGTQPIEGPTFAAGGVPGPGTPYDMFSGAPLATGEGLTQDFLLKPIFALTKNLDITTTVGYGSASGAGNVVNYWGDALMPSINPNLGSRAFTIAPAFTTHNGQDPVSATRLGFLSGALVDHNGNGALSVGWFSMHQSVPWAFSQAPWTNTPFQLGPSVPQSIGDPQPSIDVLREGPTVLPLSGADFWMKSNLATFEVATADLPAPSTAPARVLTASAIVDHGDGIRYSGELTGLTTWGPDTGNVLFGSNLNSANGVYQSTVFGQQMWVMGVGAVFPVGQADAELRFGYSCYSASGTPLASAACAPGSYLYGKVHHGFSHFDLSLDAVRFEATYAPAVLDYGTLENVWTYPAAWPGTWLRGNYQLVDNAEVGPNRQGGKIAGTFIVSGLEVRLAYAQYEQITPVNAASALSPGFVEPFFLPQTTGLGTLSTLGTLGTEQHFEGWFGYHLGLTTITLDLSQVNAWRQAPASQPQDNVSMQYPSGVLTLARPFGPKVTGAAGVGRFALNGQFDTSGPNNAQLSQDLVFAGMEFRPNGTTGYGLQYRLYSTEGLPTLPGAPSPAFHGPQILFYQRFKT
jgi:hypothetical protein